MVDLRKVSGSSFFSVFYFITGMALLLMLVVSRSLPAHVLLLGVLSLIASYGLNKQKRWGIYLMFLISLPGITFGSTTIYALYRTLNVGLMEIVLLLAAVLYVALLTASLVYAARKK